MDLREFSRTFWEFIGRFWANVENSQKLINELRKILLLTAYFFGKVKILTKLTTEPRKILLWTAYFFGNGNIHKPIYLNCVILYTYVGMFWVNLHFPKKVCCPQQNFTRFK